MAQKICGDGKSGQKPHQEKILLLLPGYMKAPRAQSQVRRILVRLESKAGLDVRLAKGGEYDY